MAIDSIQTTIIEIKGKKQKITNSLQQHRLLYLVPKKKVCSLAHLKIFLIPFTLFIGTSANTAPLTKQLKKSGARGQTVSCDHKNLVRNQTTNHLSI